MTLYHNVSANLTGEDRAAALASIHDDEKFDRWLFQFESKVAAQSQPNAAPTMPGYVKINKGEFMAKFAKEFKPPEE